jgi:hypothetical protein
VQGRNVRETGEWRKLRIARRAEVQRKEYCKGEEGRVAVSGLLGREEYATEGQAKQCYKVERERRTCE